MIRSNDCLRFAINTGGEDLILQRLGGSDRPIPFDTAYGHDYISPRYLNRILLVLPPSRLVQHENLTPDRFNEVKASLAAGWQGPPIAIVGVRDDSLYERLPTGVYLPETSFPEGLLGIADGHHRDAASEALKQVIFAQLFPLEHEELAISTWPTTGFSFPFSPQEVRFFLQHRLHVPPKSTRFVFLDETGEEKSIMRCQPTLTCPPDRLREIYAELNR